MLGESSLSQRPIKNYGVGLIAPPLPPQLDKFSLTLTLEPQHLLDPVKKTLGQTPYTSFPRFPTLQHYSCWVG